MKKLGISVFALMIGFPTLANAAVQSPADVTVDTTKHVAATSFVQGAYNALAGVARDHATQIDANTTAIAGKQDASKSTVAANGNYIVAGDGVATNLGNLDTQVKANADAISGLGNTYQAKSDSTATAGNYVTAGTGVGANLNALDTQVKANADAISGLGNTYQAKSDSTATAGNYVTAGTGVGANLNALDTQVKANADAIAGKQDASKSTVAANGNYIVAGDGVATNLGNLDTQVKANADAIATAGAKQVEVYTTWNTTATGKANALVDPDAQQGGGN